MEPKIQLSDRTVGTPVLKRIDCPGQSDSSDFPPLMLVILQKLLSVTDYME